MSQAGFTWRDGERTIVFGRGVAGRAAEHLDPGYALLTTERALAMAPGLEGPAASVHLVAPGRVDELAAGLRPAVHGELLVALGGGRVIDVAKALAAAADAPTRVAAIPTTLSAAEMTRSHRHASGVDAGTPRVRPVLVLTDPALAAGQPDAALAASAANAMAHAVEGATTTRASPVPVLAAQRAVALIADAYGPARGEGADPDRDGLALAALLAGWALDHTGYGLHHVLAQTLVRDGGGTHGTVNAALLRHTIAALEHRSPEVLAGLEAAAREPLPPLALRLAALAGATRLRELGVREDALKACASSAAGRPELDLTPPRATEAELYGIYVAAW